MAHTPLHPHWTERWIGHPAADCAALAAHVLEVEFGRTIALPAAPGGIRANDAAIRDALGGEIARPLRPRESPREGDGVLMRAAHRRACLGHHIGLYAALPSGGATTPACLHWRPGLGTVLHPLRVLPARGLKLVGLYRWEEDRG